MSFASHSLTLLPNLTGSVEINGYFLFYLLGRATAQIWASHMLGKGSANVQCYQLS